MYKHASPDRGAITCIWLVARGRRSGRGCPAAWLIRVAMAPPPACPSGSVSAAIAPPSGSSPAVARGFDLALDRRQLGGAERVAIIYHMRTERMLTAAAGPSPRDPYRHAIAMRPPLKVRPLVSLTTFVALITPSRPVPSSIADDDDRLARSARAPHALPLGH